MKIWDKHNCHQKRMATPTIPALAFGQRSYSRDLAFTFLLLNGVHSQQNKRMTELQYTQCNIVASFIQGNHFCETTGINMAPVCYRQRRYHNNDNFLLRRETGPTVYRPYPRRLERVADIAKAAISPRLVKDTECWSQQPGFLNPRPPAQQPTQQHSSQLAKPTSRRSEVTA